MIERKTVTKGHLAVYYHLEYLLEGDYKNTDAPKIIYLKDIVNIAEPIHLTSQLTMQPDRLYGAIFASEVLRKFDKKGDYSYFIPNDVIDHLIAKGILIPENENKTAFLIYPRLRPHLFEELQLGDFQKTDDEVKQLLNHTCMRYIENQAVRNECIAKLYYDYQQAKKEHKETIDQNADVDDKQQKIDSATYYGYAITISRIDPSLTEEDIEPMVLRTSISNIVFNKKKYISQIVMEYKERNCCVVDELWAHISDKYDFRLLKNPDDIESIRESVRQEIENQPTNIDAAAISEQFRTIHPLFYVLYGDSSYEDRLINMMCSKSKTYTDEYKSAVRNVLSKKTIKMIGRKGLIVDNYVLDITAKTAFRLKEFGEDVGINYLRNELSRSLIYDLMSDDDVSLIYDNPNDNSVHDDFDINRNQIYTFVCQTLGIGYSDPINPVGEQVTEDIVL